MVNSCRETPGPIPNPEAKPAHADGTATGRLWESKSPPTPNNKHNKIQQRRGRYTTALFFRRFASLKRMDQRQISTVVEQVEQGIQGLQDIDKLLAYLDSLHPDDLGGVEFLVDRMFEDERNQIWDLTESLKEFLADLKECQK